MFEEIKQRIKLRYPLTGFMIKHYWPDMLVWFSLGYTLAWIIH